MREQLGDIILVFENLKKVKEDNLFFSPIGKGKWSIAAIVAHLYFWDQFHLNSKLPYIVRYNVVPENKVNVQSVNMDAQTFAHSGIGKNELIDLFIYSRKKLILKFKEINVEGIFNANDNELTIEKYLSKVIRHDKHHIKQIRNIYSLEM